MKASIFKNNLIFLRHSNIFQYEYKDFNAQDSWFCWLTLHFDKDGISIGYQIRHVGRIRGFRRCRNSGTVQLCSIGSPIIR